MKKTIKIFFISFLLSFCLYPTKIFCAQEVTVKSNPGNPWWYESGLVFTQGSKEIARQKTDRWGNLRPVSGQVPDGLAKGYNDNGQLMMDIDFQDNRVEGLGHSYSEGRMVEEKRYHHGRLEGMQVGYHANGKVKTQGEWKNGKPIGVHKLFDDQGLLEMESGDDRGKSYENFFYPNGSIKLVGCYSNGEIVEMKEYSEDGTLRIHATQHARVHDCYLRMDKVEYKEDEPVEFSIACHCQDAKGCFSPEEFSGFNHAQPIRKIILVNEKANQYQLIYQPITASYPSEYFPHFEKFTFKDNEEIGRIKLFDSKEFHFVSKEEYSSCGKDIQCQNKVFDEGFVKIPSGTYKAWFETGSKPSEVKFTVGENK